MEIEEVGDGVWDVKSDSGKTYTVFNMDDGRYACSCPGFAFNRKDKWFQCKHIKKVITLQ